MTFPDDLTVDEAYDAAAEMDFQIADAAMAAARSIEEGNLEEARSHLETVLDLNNSMHEAAEIGDFDDWIEYCNALAEHTEEAQQAIKEDREWDAFEGAIDIPELAKRYLGRP